MSSSSISLIPRADDANVRRNMESITAANLKRSVQERDQPDQNRNSVADSQQRWPTGAAVALRTSAGAGELGNDGVQRAAGVEGQEQRADGYSKSRPRMRRYRGSPSAKG